MCADCSVHSTFLQRLEMGSQDATRYVLKNISTTSENSKQHDDMSCVSMFDTHVIQLYCECITDNFKGKNFLFNFLWNVSFC